MFNQDESLEEEDVQSCLSFYIKEDGEMYIDVHLADYKEKTLINFAKVIASLSSTRLQLETIHMVKNGFIEIEKIEECHKVLEEVARITIKETALIDQATQKKEGEPCIKPLDML